MAFGLDIFGHQLGISHVWLDDFHVAEETSSSVSGATVIGSSFGGSSWVLPQPVIGSSFGGSTWSLDGFDLSRPFYVDIAKLREVSRPFYVDAGKFSEVSRPFYVDSNTFREVRRIFYVDVGAGREVSRPFYVSLGELPPISDFDPTPVDDWEAGGAGAVIRASVATGSDTAVLLFDSSGAQVPMSAFSLTSSANQGWTGSMSLPYSYPIDFPEDDEFKVVVRDGFGHTVESPPMIAAPRSTGQSISAGDFSNLNLIDKTSYLLGENKVNLGFFDGQSQEIIDAAVLASGVPIQGLQDFPVRKINLQNQKIWDAVLRVAGAQGKIYTINSDGGVDFYDSRAGYIGGRPVPVSNWERERDPLREFGAWSLAKTSPINLSGRQLYTFDSVGFKRFPLQNPLINIALVRPFNVIGFGAWITLFDSEDLPVFFSRLGRNQGAPPSPPLTGSFPAVSASIVIFPDPVFPLQPFVQIEINGTPLGLEPGIDPSFHIDFGSGRHKGSTYTEQLWATKAQAESFQDSILEAGNRGVRSISASGPLWCAVLPGDPVRFASSPLCRLETITWSGQSQQIPRTSYVGSQQVT